MQQIRISIFVFVAAVMGVFLSSITGHAQNFASAPVFAVSKQTPPLLLVQNQNPFSPYTIQQTPERPVSPINPGTLPGSTAAVGGTATGTNPITGLPCNGTGSLSVSGAGGLPGTATPPPGLSTETLDQIPVGTPPVTSIYGSQTNLGAC